MTALLHKLHDSVCHICDDAIEHLTGECVNEAVDVYPDDLSDVLGGHLS